MHSTYVSGFGCRLSRLLPLFVALLLSSQLSLAAATTQYVSDTLVITLREGKGTQYRIIRTLKTGTPVEILEEDKDYVKVRIGSGEVGYVLKQYLTEEPPKSELISALQKEVEELKAQLGSGDSGRAGIRAQLAQSQEQQGQLSSQLEVTAAALQTVQAQYAELKQNSENVVALSTERDRLAAENGQLATELEGLRGAQGLFRTEMVEWFLAGGGVFFGGWLTGKISRKKRRNGFS